MSCYNIYHGQNVQSTPSSSTISVHKVTAGEEYEEPVYLWEWLLVFGVLLVPPLAIVVYLIWAFGDGTKKRIARFCRGYLLFQVIVILLLVVFAVLSLI